MDNRLAAAMDKHMDGRRCAAHMLFHSPATNTRTRDFPQPPQLLLLSMNNKSNVDEIDKRYEYKLTVDSAVVVIIIHFT